MADRSSPACSPPASVPELTEHERSVIARLLSRPFPGAQALREQVPHLRVSARASCCASVGLTVAAPEGRRVPRLPGADSLVERPLPVAGRWADPAGGEPLEALLFERAGWLSHLEVLHEQDTRRVELPDPVVIELVDAF